MVSRPTFSIDEFVRARLAFDHGNGPAEAWSRINEISLWRLDELAEEAGSRTWSILVAPVEPKPDHVGVQQRLRHAVRSGGLGNLELPAFWRVRTGRVYVSHVLVVYEIEAQRAVRLARRYGHVAVVHVQRIRYEDVVLRAGWWKARFSLEPIHQAKLGSSDFQGWSESALDENTDKSFAWAKDNWQSIQDKKVDYPRKWNAKPQTERDEQTLLVTDGR